MEQKGWIIKELSYVASLLKVIQWFTLSVMEKKEKEVYSTLRDMI